MLAIFALVLCSERSFIRISLCLLSPARKYAPCKWGYIQTPQTVISYRIHLLLYEQEEKHAMIHQ